MAHTTTFILSAGDYFVANLDNGGVRVGLLGVTAFDYPADHADYSTIAGLTAENVEETCDVLFAKFH